MLKSETQSKQLCLNLKWNHVFVDGESDKTLKHLFFSCHFTLAFWKEIIIWFIIGHNIVLDPLQTLFYVDNIPQKYLKLIIFSLGKYQIHCKNLNICLPTAMGY